MILYTVQYLPEEVGHDVCLHYYHMTLVCVMSVEHLRKHQSVYMDESSEAETDLECIVTTEINDRDHCYSIAVMGEPTLKECVAK